MNVTEFLTKIYGEIQESYVEGTGRVEDPFYSYVQNKYCIYKRLLNLLDEQDLVNSIEMYGFFKGKITKKRFINFCDLIFKECIAILEHYYKGDTWTACKKLYALLKSKKKISRYWEDEYVNCFSFEFLNNRACLYRMVDMDGKPNNCWHIPYEIRRYASYSRYSMAGMPCLYLADSKETANIECGKVQEGKQRWFSCFTPKNEQTLFFDLRIPTKDEFSNYNLIDLIITYPIRFLTSVKVMKTDGRFHEEYYFPQLLFHLFFMSDMAELRCSYKGFVYSSTSNRGGVNYVLPALYKQKKPILNGISHELEKLFDVTDPAIYE